MEEKVLINENKEFITLNEFLKFTNFISTGGQAKYYLQENEVYISEINTLPGFTSISMYPKLFDNVGIKYSDLLDRLIELSKE